MESIFIAENNTAVELDSSGQVRQKYGRDSCLLSMTPETHTEPPHLLSIEVQGVYAGNHPNASIPSGGVGRSQHRSGLKS